MLKRNKNIKNRFLQNEKNVFKEDQNFSDLTNQFTNFMIFLSSNNNVDQMIKKEKFYQKSLKTQH